MEANEVIKTLKEYNKWRRGKGKKYSHPGFPFDPSVIGYAIDSAVKHLSKRMDKDDFMCIYSMVQKHIADRKIMKASLTDNEKKAFRSMRKVIRYLVKDNK